MDLKVILEHFVAHRQVVVRRRTEYELKIAEARAHILEGLNLALDDIDAVIATIKKSETKEAAKDNLMKKFKLSELQAKAILEMRLQTLAGLERQKIEDELKEKKAFIKECKAILADPKRILKIVSAENQEIIDKYGDERRTQINIRPVGEFNALSLIPDEPMIVAITEGGYTKRMSPTVYRTQGRGGKGVIGMTTKEEDEISQILHTRTHHELLFFTSVGRVFRLPVHEIPVGTRISRGQAIVNLLQLGKDEKVTVMLDANATTNKGEFLFMATNHGTVKKTSFEEFKNVRRSGLIAIKLRPDDLLEWVKATSINDQVVIVSSQGKCIRFKESDVRSMGRPSMGVRGIRLKGDDRVVQMDVIKNPDDSSLLVVMENGLSKATPVNSYRFQGRGGSGVKTAQITAKTGKVIGARVIEGGMEGDLILISRHGQTIRMALKQIPSIGRATQGVYVMRMKENDKVASLSVIIDEAAKVETPELPLKK